MPPWPFGSRFRRKNEHFLCNLRNAAWTGYRRGRKRLRHRTCLHGRTLCSRSRSRLELSSGRFSLGLGRRTDRRVSLREAPLFHLSGLSVRNPLPDAGLGGSSRDSLRKNSFLSGTHPSFGTRRPFHTARCVGYRPESRDAGHPLPQSHRIKWSTGRIRRRGGAEKVSSGAGKDDTGKAMNRCFLGSMRPEQQLFIGTSQPCLPVQRWKIRPSRWPRRPPHRESG